MLFSGCSKDPEPEDRFADFVANWRDQNFSEMYDQLTANVKKNIKKDEFVSRYEKIYQDSGVKQLKIDFKKPKEEIKPDKNGNITFPFAVSMETLAGKISFENKAVLKKKKQIMETIGELNGILPIFFLSLMKEKKFPSSRSRRKEGRFLTEMEKDLPSMACCLKSV